VAAPKSETARRRSPARSRGPSVPVLEGSGNKLKDLTLDAGVFGAELKPHLVHETVRAEQNASRAGTRALKSRGLVAGGRSKPWRQKGTGRARAGSTRAPQWTGGAAAFAPRTSFGGKVNRKERKAAFRAALSAHADEGTLGVLGSDSFDAPSTKSAAAFVEAWGKERPLLVVAQAGEDAIAKSFRNLEGVLVMAPPDLDVATLVWARSLLVSEAALGDVEGKAGS
jgi:large subunit ribosomal protein L4